MTSAISVEGLSKAYRIGVKEKNPDTLASAAASWMRTPFANIKQLTRLNTFRPNESDDDLHWALKDISFEVQDGDVVGMIGHNGAGKSTLLKILSRITRPTAGRAIMRGRVSSLLEVGTGFHPELSGRDNIYMNGTILGMRKAEIDRKFDEIVEFSGVEKFLDTPTKRYSSGMKVRLAFAVAAHLEPEILVIDEVLAVGDAEFQNKCLARMRNVAGEGRTVIFVSHNLGAVGNLCNRALLLDGGVLCAQGGTTEIIDMYLDRARPIADQTPIRTFELDDNKPAQLLSVKVVDINGEPTLQHRLTDGFQIQLEFLVREKIRSLVPLVRLCTSDGTVLLTWSEAEWVSYSSNENRSSFPKNPGEYEARLTIPPRILNVGDYFAEIRLVVPGREKLHRFQVPRIQIIDPGCYISSLHQRPRKGILAIPCEWSIRTTSEVLSCND